MEFIEKTQRVNLNDDGNINEVILRESYRDVQYDLHIDIMPSHNSLWMHNCVMGGLMYRAHNMSAQLDELADFRDGIHGLIDRVLDQEGITDFNEVFAGMAYTIRLHDQKPTVMFSWQRGTESFVLATE